MGYDVVDILVSSCDWAIYVSLGPITDDSFARGVEAPKGRVRQAIIVTLWTPLN